MTLKHIFYSLISLVFPSLPAISNIETMSVTDFYEATGPPRTILPDLAITALFDYQNSIVKEAILQIKYAGNQKIAQLFAQCLYHELLAEMEDLVLFSGFTNPIIIPMPLSKERLKARGYNQLSLILEEMKAFDTGRVFTYTRGLLTKPVDTPQQTAMKTREERMKNLRKCFSVPYPSLIEDRNIILVDDVTTTGTTLAQARRALLGAGARKVFCIALAH
jgi:competence protein ComFC